MTFEIERWRSRNPVSVSRSVSIEKSRSVTG
jgi:hypothetical protein